MGCEDIFVCERDGRYFTDMDSLFHKAQNEARLCLISNHYLLEIFAGVVIIDLITPARRSASRS